MYLMGIGAAFIILFLQYVFQHVAYFTQESYNGCVRMTIVQKPGAVQEIEAFLLSQKIEVGGAKVHKKKRQKLLWSLMLFILLVLTKHICFLLWRKGKMC